MSSNPTYVILDSGCTRVSSRFAMDRLVKACLNHRYSHLIKFTKEASNNKFSCANGESSHVKEKLVIHRKNPKHRTGLAYYFGIDSLDKGGVPILFSVETDEELEREHRAYTGRRISHLSSLWIETICLVSCKTRTISQLCWNTLDHLSSLQWKTSEAYIWWTL